MLEKLDYYTLYVKSPINILSTGNSDDISQKNFEILVQAIGLKVMPVLMDRPLPVSNLKEVGSVHLNGSGYVCTFSVLKDKTSIDDFINAINNIVLHNSEVIKTKGTNKNVEIVKERNKKLAWFRHFLKRLV